MSKSIRTIIAAISLLGLGAQVHAQANDVDCSKCVDTKDIGFQAVTTGKIDQKAVTSSKLADGAVTTSKIKNGAITADKLAPGLSSSLTAPPEFRFVGFSTSQVDGGAGFFGMTAACQADYGPNSRLATSKEFVESTIQPALTAASAWVQPVYVVALSSNTYDHSGYPNPRNCTTWTTNLSGLGLAVLPDGGFVESGCGNTLPVACSSSQ